MKLIIPQKSCTFETEKAPQSLGCFYPFSIYTVTVDFFAGRRGGIGVQPRQAARFAGEHLRRKRQALLPFPPPFFRRERRAPSRGAPQTSAASSVTIYRSAPSSSILFAHFTLSSRSGAAFPPSALARREQDDLRPLADHRHGAMVEVRAVVARALM